MFSLETHRLLLLLDRAEAVALEAGNQAGQLGGGAGDVGVEEDHVLAVERQGEEVSVAGGHPCLVSAPQSITNGPN